MIYNKRERQATTGTAALSCIAMHSMHDCLGHAPRASLTHTALLALASCSRRCSCPCSSLLPVCVEIRSMHGIKRSDEAVAGWTMQAGRHPSHACGCRSIDPTPHTCCYGQMEGIASNKKRDSDDDSHTRCPSGPPSFNHSSCLPASCLASIDQSIRLAPH